MNYTKEFLIKELFKITDCTFDELNSLTVYQLENMYDRITRHELKELSDKNDRMKQ